MKHTTPMMFTLAALALGGLSLSHATPDDPPTPNVERVKQIQRELLALGPSPEERLKAFALDRDQTQALLLKLKAIQQVKADDPVEAERQRRTLRQELLKRFGIKAAPQLIEALPKRPYWSARAAAEALGFLALGDHAAQVKWLAYREDAPRKLINMFGRGPKAERDDLKRDLNRTLSALSGEDHDTAKEWLAWWTKAGPKWAKAERAREAKRAALKAELKRLLPKYAEEDAPQLD